MLSLLLCALLVVAPGEGLNVQDEGEGPAVLLVPGLSGCIYSYRDVVPLLTAAGLRTVAIDPLAIGLSNRPADADYTLTAQAERLGAVLDELGVDSVVVVAQGVGATMAFRLALARPGLVRGIVSIEGGPLESASTPMVRRGLKLGKFISSLGGASIVRGRYADGLRAASGDDSWVDKTTVRKYFRGASRDVGATLDAFLAMSEQPEPTPLAPRLPELTMPVVLVIGGAEHKGSLNPDLLTLMRASLPDLTEVTIADVGHFPMEESPDELAQVVIDLTAAVASDAPSPR